MIDNMGIERESQYTLETVYTVIDERYKSGKPFIITTNIQLGILGNPQDLEHARIYDFRKDKGNYMTVNKRAKKDRKEIKAQSRFVVTREFGGTQTMQ